MGASREPDTATRGPAPLRITFGTESGTLYPVGQLRSPIVPDGKNANLRASHPLPVGQFPSRTIQIYLGIILQSNLQPAYNHPPKGPKADLVEVQGQSTGRSQVVL
jgi:hypothetical protein